jgi:hypothetical protein
MAFAPPIVFDRNASSVPVTVRLTDILWSMAGMSTIYPSSLAKIPTSAYSLSLSLLASAGFHDPGPNGVRPPQASSDTVAEQTDIDWRGYAHIHQMLVRDAR